MLSMVDNFDKLILKILFQFRASSDRAWEENVPQQQTQQSTVRTKPNPFAVPSAPSSRQAQPPQANDLYDDHKKAKKSRWN